MGFSHGVGWLSICLSLVRGTHLLEGEGMPRMGGCHRCHRPVQLNCKYQTVCQKTQNNDRPAQYLVLTNGRWPCAGIPGAAGSGVDSSWNFSLPPCVPQSNQHIPNRTRGIEHWHWILTIPTSLILILSLYLHIKHTQIQQIMFNFCTRSKIHQNLLHFAKCKPSLILQIAFTFHKTEP